MKRYQDCDWITKLWRLRYRIPVLWETPCLWFIDKFYPSDPECHLTWKDSYDINMGIADIKMNYLIDSKDIPE